MALNALQLELFSPQSQQTQILYALVQRRNDLKQMLIAEKNRLQAPGIELVKEKLSTLSKSYFCAMESITCQIDALIKEDRALTDKKKILNLYQV